MNWSWDVALPLMVTAEKPDTPLKSLTAPLEELALQPPTSKFVTVFVENSSTDRNALLISATVIVIEVKFDDELTWIS